MHLVVAALGDDVDGGAGAAAELCFRIAGDGNFSERVDGKNGGGRAPDAGLVDGRQVAVAVVHVGAVEQVIIGAAAIPVEAKQSVRAGGFRRTDRIACGTGNQIEQLCEVAAVDRQFSQLGGFERAAGVVGRGFNQGHVGRDLDDFFDHAGRQFDISTGRRTDAHGNLREGCGAEARFLNCDVVGAEGQLGGHILAEVVGGHDADQAGVGAENLDLCAWNGSAGGVGDGALNASAEGLRRRKADARNQGKE